MKIHAEKQNSYRQAAAGMVTHSVQLEDNRSGTVLQKKQAEVLSVKTTKPAQVKDNENPVRNHFNTGSVIQRMIIGQKNITGELINHKSAYKKRLNKIISEAAAGAGLAPNRIRRELTSMVTDDDEFDNMRAAVLVAIDRIANESVYGQEEHDADIESADEKELFLDEVIAHSENILNTQLGRKKRDAPLWDQVDHLLQAEEYWEKTKGQVETPSKIRARNALHGTKIKLDTALSAFGNPRTIIESYLNETDFNQGFVVNPLVDKSRAMREILN